MPSGSTVVIKYDGTDITSYVEFADATFEAAMNAVPGTFAFSCKDPSQALSFVTGKKITLDIDGVRIFGGYLTQVSRGYAFDADKVPGSPGAFKNRIWKLAGVDYNILFDKRVLRRPADYLSQIPTVVISQTDGQLIGTLCSSYLDLPSGFDSTSFIDGIKTFSSFAWEQQGTKWRVQMEDFVQWTAALYYIDGNLALHHHSIATTVKRWGFSDKPNNNGITASPATYQGATMGPREVDGVEDGSILVNDMFVWGGSPFAGSGGTVFSRSTDATSETAHGVWQQSETDFGVQGFGLQAGVDARSTLVVNGSTDAISSQQNVGLKYPQWNFQFGWFAHDVPILSGVHNHLVPGELSTITLWVYSTDGGVTPLTQVLPMRSVRVTFPDLDHTGKGYVRFDGTFGLQHDDPFTLWRFLLQQQKLATSVAAIVGSTDNSSTAFPFGSDGDFILTPNPGSGVTVFTAPAGYVAGTTTLLLNGLGQRRGTDYLESDPEAGQITMTTAPVATDNPLELLCKVLG
jgi:hypothetical protein